MSAGSKYTHDELVQKMRPHIKNMVDTQQSYIKFVKEATESGKLLDLGDMFPVFAQPGESRVYPLLPGSLVVVVSYTRGGKSTFCQNINRHYNWFNHLRYDLELSEEMVYQRYGQMEFKKDYDQWWDAHVPVRDDIAPEPDHYTRADYVSSLNHIWTCPLTRLSVAHMKAGYDAACVKVKEDFEAGMAKTPEPPFTITVDYTGLMSVRGSQSMSDMSAMLAPDLRSLAKETGTVVIAVCQTNERSDRQDSELGLSSAKWSSEFENSSNLHLSLYQKASGATVIQVNKQTFGADSIQSDVDFDKPTLRMEGARLYEADPFDDNPDNFPVPDDVEF